MRLKALLKYALLGLNQATGFVHLSRKRDSRRGPAAVGLSIGNVAVLIAGEGHGKGSVKNEPLCDLCVKGDGTTGRGEGVLHIFPTIVGVGPGNTFYYHGIIRTVVTESGSNCDNSNNSVTILNCLCVCAGFICKPIDAAFGNLGYYGQIIFKSSFTYIDKLRMFCGIHREGK